jgi:NAD-dependent SIR2 family protein deacetylase
MNTHDEPLLDHRGQAMFYCTRCNGPISRSDIVEFGARLPDHGETADEYLDSQLLDGIEHPRCTAGAAGS